MLNQVEMTYEYLLLHICVARNHMQYLGAVQYCYLFWHTKPSTKLYTKPV
ncbi:MAG: hypothetical protein ACI9C4_002299 [Paraglaciecola sp.]|jgi:hypothetical protein